MANGAAWIGLAGVVIVALIPIGVRYCGQPSKFETATVTGSVCVVKKAGLDDPNGACDRARGDKEVQAGTTKDVAFPVKPGVLPPRATVNEVVAVTGGQNFKLFTGVAAKFKEGNIIATVTPNETGGYNDTFTFTIFYTVAPLASP